MKRLLSVTVLLALSLAPIDAFATPQIGEFLIYKGERIELPFAAPLESYFSASNPRPKLPAPSSACWRGYVGVWKIENKRLYLVALKDGRSWERAPLGNDMPLDELFKDKKPPIHATWYSDVLCFPRGKKLTDGFMGMGATYEKDCYITIEKGNVVREHVVDYKGEGATRSHADLRWVALGGGPVKDDGKWHDARLIGTRVFTEIRESGEEFTTRGIFYEAEDERPDSLMIPGTRTTQFVSIELRFARQEGKDGPRIEKGTHVEIKGRLEGVGDAYFLKVESFRALKPGETIHHPNFRPPNQTLETDVE